MRGRSWGKTGPPLPALRPGKSGGAKTVSGGREDLIATALGLLHTGSFTRRHAYQRVDIKGATQHVT